MSARTSRQQGFTIVELLIATLVFSMILLLMSVALIQITRLYYKGITTARTQQTARNIMDSVTRGIQFSGGTVSAAPTCPSGPTNPCYFCVNDDRYTYQTNKQLVDGPLGTDQARHVFIKESAVASCTTGGPGNLVTPPAGAVELMGTNMRLVKMQLSGAGNLYSVSVRLVAGESDLLCSPSVAGDCNTSAPSSSLTNNDVTCKNITKGTQFCAAAELQSTVQKRI